MSEVKRVSLTSFEPQKLGAKQPKKCERTVRISVALPTSTEDTCPEFNYKEELASAKKKSKPEKEKNGLENGFDPFEGENNDDDVKRIAMEMEAKYGTSSGASVKKKKKGCRDDYADIGMGYDESDSFIDNTDGYDEIIPANITTLCGGFYVNSGALVFKTDDEASSEDSSSSDSDSAVEKSVKRKRVIDSDEDSKEADKEKSKNDVEKKPKLISTKTSIQQAIKKKLFSPNKIQVKKRRLIDPIKKTVKDLLREKRKDLDMSIPNDLNASENNVEKDSSKENKKPMSLDSVTDAIESVVKDTTKYDGDTNSGIPTPVEIVQKSKIDVVPGSSSHEVVKSVSTEIVKLPENLPGDILEIINNIKKAASNYKDCGKVKFFTDEVNSMLLSLERNCKCLGKSSRLKVYEHLAPFVKCKKDTLIRRAKNLILDEEMKKLKSLLMKLKAQINQTMPTLLVQYERECQRVQIRNLESSESDEVKKARLPKRKFRCSEDMKKLLKDILNVKKRCLVLEGKSKNSLDETIQEFLKTDIQILWPEGWMSGTSLRKLCDSLKTPQKFQIPEPPKVTTTTEPSTISSSLTIIPIDTVPPAKIVSNPVVNEVSISRINEKAAPKTVDINPISAEIKALQQLKDSGVIVVNKSSDVNKIKKDSEETVIPKPSHCQIINLSEKVVKVPEMPLPISDGDDIKKVMENLRALQQLSSPSKSESSLGSPVSVIAVNKSVSPKSQASSKSLNGRPETAQRDEFQRQFINSLSHVAAAPPSGKQNFNFGLP